MTSVLDLEFRDKFFKSKLLRRFIIRNLKFDSFDKCISYVVYLFCLATVTGTLSDSC